RRRGRTLSRDPLPLLQPSPFPIVLALQALGRSPSPALIQVLKSALRSPQSHLAQPFLLGQVLHPSDHLPEELSEAGEGQTEGVVMVTIAKSKKFRDNHGKVLLEGHRLIKDALQAGAVPQTLFFSTVGHLKLLPEAEIKRASLVKVKFEDVKTWSDLVTPQGLLGIFSKPDPAKMSYPAAQLANSLPLLLICDNIRDPGNLGTILRSAAGAGCEKVLLTKGCVDPWEPKVLRAGMGAHFRVPIIANLDWDSVPTNLPAGIQVCVADNNHPGRGAGSAPASPKAPVKSSPKAAPEHEEEEGAAIPELAVQHYYKDWARAPVAVVIGGETQGLSPGALGLAASTGGRRLLIPVVPGVDSLNSAIAAGIVLFEGRRQLLWRHKQEDGRQKLPVPG
uniref:RNA 2-O ribose methyltransferase substrate binding domain-containing protein n=1 Tax=Serinus canaria TaxID=9135 RepID=A0A8C9UDS3_SERCA